MKKLLIFALAMCFTLPALADGYDLTVKSVQELKTQSGGAASGDYTVRYDASADEFVKVDATTNTVSNLVATATVDTSGISASTALTGNPLVQATRIQATTAQANTFGGYTFLTGVSGDSIIPSGPVMVQASGTASGATAIVIQCSGGRVLSSFPIGLLVDDVPVGSLTSAGPGNISVTNGAGLVEGCPSGESVQISKTGSDLATTTSLFVTLPYIVQ